MAGDVSSSSLAEESSVGDSKRAKETGVTDVANGDTTSTGYERYLELRQSFHGPAKKRLVRKRTDRLNTLCGYS